jgi:hypothetical protein
VRRATLIVKVINFEQNLFANGRMLDLTEAAAQRGRALNSTFERIPDERGAHGAKLYHSWRSIMKKLSVLAIIVGGALLAAAPFSLQWSPEKNVMLSLDRADARVGRPLTATSVAGVNRRVHRRAYRRAIY